MDGRVDAVCANYFAALAGMGRAAAGAEVYDGPDVLLVAGPTAHPAANFAARCGAAAGLERGLRFFQERRRSFSWVITPADRPAELPARLWAHGLVRTAGLTGMYLQGAPRPVPAPDGVTLHEAGPETPAPVRGALESLHAQAFDLPADVNALLMAGMWGQVDAPPSPRRGRLYFAAAGGRPAALCYALPAAGTVGIYSVATHPRQRRRGIAGALVARAAADGLAAGAGAAVLHAVDGAESVYARVGFRPVCAFAVFSPAPGGLAPAPGRGG